MHHGRQQFSVVGQMTEHSWQEIIKIDLSCKTMKEIVKDNIILYTFGNANQIIEDLRVEFMLKIVSD